MRRLVSAVVALMLSCAPSELAAADHHLDELHGGSVDSANTLPQVFMMRMKFDTGAQFACTATLITSRTLLAAAHCFDPAAGPPGLTSLTDVYVQNAATAPNNASPTWIRIDPAQTRMHPMWSASDRLSYDIAAALLPTASTVTPSPHRFAPLTQNDIGQTMTVAGFGITAPGNTDYGLRRVAQLPLKGFTAKHVQLGDTTDTGICNGDSGGPSFLTGRDGVKRVVGVHSYDSSLQCTDGLDTRVDLFAQTFVQDFITDFEGRPTCFEDGMCASGCATPDVDCVCQADGTCNGACPNLLTDPDCPADCVANNVCATENCPVLDPDCAPEFGVCATDWQCQYRACVVDARRPQPYCSRPCSAGCPTGTTCENDVCLQPVAGPRESCDSHTFCLEDTTCTGFIGHDLVCSDTCMSGSDCPAGSDCIDAQNGKKLCIPLGNAGDDCIAEITRCQNQTSCTGLPGEVTSCLATCMNNSGCASDESCVDAQFSVKVCAKNPIELPAADGKFDAAGCSASGAGALAWLLLLSLRRRR